MTESAQRALSFQLNIRSATSSHNLKSWLKSIRKRKT